MTTKKLYDILDKVSIPQTTYNLRKFRNADIWRIRVWVSKTLDKLGILAPYVEDSLYPEHYETDDTIADFKALCNTAIKNCSK